MRTGRALATAVRVPVEVDVAITGPADPTFLAWLERSMTWLPDAGMGYLPAEPIDYGDGYWEKYVEYARTALGRRLTVLRIEMVQRHVDLSALGRSRGPAETKVIDVGVGCGDFVERAAETFGAPVYGYDVSRRAVEWLTDRGLYRDPYAAPVDVATFWDSLEHILDAHRLLANVRDWVFAALPIVPGDGPPPQGWKHVRPGEHYWYWTRDGFVAWMAAQGFRCVEHNTAESLAGREDVGAFAFRRVE